MQITRLRLLGFKSFVEPTELLIEPGLTGIVGPNGCGKSNLLEALRWVMGANSAKAMRAGVVWVNCFDRGSMAVPFGGFKQSGFGRDKSIHAMDKYTDLKAVWFAH